jgi:hypothetical protein
VSQTDTGTLAPTINCTQPSPGGKVCLISVNVYKAATRTFGALELKQWSEKGHKARASALQNHNPYAGFITATHALRTNVLMIPCMHSTDDKDLILDTKSNNAMTPEARVMEPAALQSFIGIATRDRFPEGSKIPPPSTSSMKTSNSSIRRPECKKPLRRTLCGQSQLQPPRLLRHRGGPYRPP